MEGYQPISASALDMPYTDQTYIPEKPLMMQAYTEGFSVPAPIDSGQELSLDASCRGNKVGSCIRCRMQRIRVSSFIILDHQCQ
jgi:hypothetical protein